MQIIIGIILFCIGIKKTEKSLCKRTPIECKQCAEENKKTEMSLCKLIIKTLKKCIGIGKRECFLCSVKQEEIYMCREIWIKEKSLCKEVGKPKK